MSTPSKNVLDAFCLDAASVTDALPGCFLCRNLRYLHRKTVICAFSQSDWHFGIENARHWATTTTSILRGCCSQMDRTADASTSWRSWRLGPLVFVFSNGEEATSCTCGTVLSNVLVPCDSCETLSRRQCTAWAHSQRCAAWLFLFLEAQNPEQEHSRYVLSGRA